MTAEMEQSHWLSDVIIESRYRPEIFEFYSFAFCNLSYSLGDRNDRCSAASSANLVASVEPRPYVNELPLRQIWV